MKVRLIFLVFCLTGLLLLATNVVGPMTQTTAASPPVYSPATPLADDPDPPDEPVKLIFIHHSTGGNWLADIGQHESAGGLGSELMDNNYYVSATNYGWEVGGDAIGDRTDIGNWWEWFRGPNRDAIMAAVYTENGQNIGDYGSWSRLPDPGGENEIIMFKSCFPNSHLGGSPDDPPTTGDNPLRGQDAWSGDAVHNVANAKGIYNDILEYMETRQDKLFVVITAPPLLEDDMYQPTDAAHAANARAFNDWLVNDWLDGYAYDNVAVFDFYNVLTSNGGDPNTNDLGAEAGNHHRWWSGAVQHVHPVGNDFSAYGVSQDSHPTGAGGQKATQEFVELLNIYYNRWQGGAAPGPSLTLTAPNGGETWTVSSQHAIQWTTSGTVAQVNLAYSTNGFATRHDIATGLANTGSYNWTIPDDPSTTVRVRVESTVSPTTVYDDSNADFSIQQAAADSLTLTAPNGGENWLVGSQHAIQWTTTGSIPQVDLMYSTDGFVTSDTIASSLNNTGSYNWTTPITPTTTARVRVANSADPSLYDDSNADFTLYESGTFSTTLYLPIVLRNASLEPPDCPFPLIGVSISGPTSGGSTSNQPAPSKVTRPEPPNAKLETRNSIAAQPTNLTAFHRSGQTFLTWTEDTGASGESYHVYRHTAPIDAGNIDQATRLTEQWGPLPEGSSIFYTDRDREPGGSLFAGLQNYVITDLGTELADTTGLFVWTSKEAGNFYYAVTTVEGGVEDRTNFGAGNSLTDPVAETVDDPDPILVWESSSGNGRVYTQFMDWAAFNPTFERPANHPDGGLQYAYNYFVGLPTADQCGGALPASLPIILHIEGHGSRYIDGPDQGGSSTYFCAVEIWGDSPRQAWYYGFSASYDYRDGYEYPAMPDSGPIVNYAEERLLCSIYDTLRDPYYSAYNLDDQRIYVYGHSMGGSGALAMAMRYPNVFAASYSSEPMTNYRTSGGGAAEVDWTEECQAKWGSIASNFPISNVGRYAGHLATYNGTGVWDWQNHQENLVSRSGDEMAHISLAHGSNDHVIEWSTQGQPAYGAFYDGRRAFSGATVDYDHTWVSFEEGLGPTVGSIDDGPFYGFSVVRDETIPGLSNASGSSSVPPSGPGETYNMNLEWSASWDAWDGAPIDTASQWRISLRSTSGSDQTVDVTPRRLQNFAVTAGANYNWENRLVSDDSLVASGAVTADADGLVTVPNFAVSSGGNRLVLTPAGGPVPASLNLTSPTGGENWQVGEQHQVRWTTTGSVAQVNLYYSTNSFATSNTIASAINNTGSYNWTIPNDPSTTAQVRVESVLSPTTVYDVSGSFSISEAGGGNTYTFTADIVPTNATPPVNYTWSPAPLSGQGTAVATYQWETEGVYEIEVEVQNCGGTFTDTHTITIGTPPTCPVPLTGVSISDPIPAFYFDGGVGPTAPNSPAQETMAFQDGVSPSGSYSGTSDVILAQDASDNANLGGAENLEVFLGTGNEHRRSLMRWDISALPTDITVEAASLELYRFDGDANTNMSVDLYRVTREWVEGTGWALEPGPGYVPDGATWLTATTGVAWTTPGGDYDAAVIDQITLPAGMANGWVRLDATTAVQAWVGGVPNYGLLLIPQSGEYYHYFYSRNWYTPTLRPRLIVTYTIGSLPASLTLIAPNGGENWTVGSQRQIQWTSTGSVPQVDLYYSTDSFVTSNTIASGVSNSGSYAWTVPNDPSATARVRVESTISPTTVRDESDADFSISQAAGGYTYTFNAIVAPANATLPIDYTWSPTPASGQGTASATYHWDADGVYEISVVAENCGGAVSAARTITLPLSGGAKWSLWTSGTNLRGANIYQRRVYPEIDDLQVIGPGPVGPPYTQTDFNQLAALGANYVNISHPGLFTEAPPYAVDQEIQTNLDNLLDMIAQADMYAVISFRTGPGRSEFTFMWDEAGTWFDESYLNDSMWGDQAAQDAWVEMWRYTAQRYQDNPVVVGYDLMVEPNSNETGADVLNAPLNIWDPDEFYPAYAGTLYDWNQLYPEITTAIRQVDADTPILVSAMSYGSLDWLPYLELTGDAYTLYAFHQYAPTQYTHQWWDSIECSYPGLCDLDRDGVADDTFDQAWLDALLTAADTFTLTHGVPVAVNEFGLMRWEPGGDQFMDDQMDLLEGRGINYALWMWDPAWYTWTQHLDAFNFRHGPDPANHTDVPTNALQLVIEEHWGQNTMYPSFAFKEE